MRKLNVSIALLFILLFCIMSNTFAQNENPDFITEENTTNPDSKESSKVFIGVGTGINNYTGLLGATLELKITNKTTLFLVAGTGGWGNKIGGGIALYPKQATFGNCFSAGISLATGIYDYKISMEVENHTEPVDLEMDLNPAATLNIMYSYNFHMKAKSKFVLRTGLAIALIDEPYSIKTGNYKLTDTSKSIMNLYQPGGLIIGLDFLFGL